MNRTYYQRMEVTDLGPYITGLILVMPRPVRQEELCPEQFSVYTEVLDLQGNIVQLPLSFIQRDVFVPSKGYRVIRDVYPSDAQGERCEESVFVTLDMQYGPLYPCSSAIAADFTNINGHQHYTDNTCTITQLKPIGEGNDKLTGLVFDHCARVINPDVDLWLHDVSHYAPQPLGYGYYVPRTESAAKHPLIVWLHGAGEGGTDTAITYSGNKVTALTYPENQEKFGGAYIFAPQCPTMWLDDGSGRYGDSAQSMYGKALKAAIDEFIARHAAAIDTGRIYVGGDSNGGFMTMRMIFDYPDFFAAAFPICEAFLDERATDEQIASIKDLPIWFTHSKDDPVVVPERHVVPTYERLVKAGSKTVHFTFWDGIYDLHGLFADADGRPWKYLGHFAWVPVLNNDCVLDYDGSPVMTNGKPTPILDWLAAQHK